VSPEIIDFTEFREIFNPGFDNLIFENIVLHLVLIKQSQLA